jgi:hypothetical protein
MSRHRDSLRVAVDADAAEQACRAAISELGWRVLEDDGRRLVTKEVTPQAISFTWSAKIEVLVEEDGDESEIRLNGSITGMGPVQKGHLKGQVGALKNKIGLAAQDSHAVESPPEDADDVTGKLERLADLRENGVLSEEEFARAKAQILDRG